MYSKNSVSLRHLLIIAIIIVGFCGCKSDEAAFGEPCSREANTRCDSLCLLDLPNGMCSHDCSEDEDICPADSFCADISGGRYCLAACEENSDCREDMICVVDVCRGIGGFGDGCGENEDCESEICNKNICSFQCEDHSDCGDGITCVDQGNGTRLCVDLDYGDSCETDEQCRSGICHDDICNTECHSLSDCLDGLSCIDTGDGVPICLNFDPPSGGEGMFGENCTFVDCAEGFDCISRTENPADDPYAYCTSSCLNELDCPAEMTCRDTQSEGEGDAHERCVPREYCERCAYDTQCGLASDRCVSQSPERGSGRYCSRVCNPERPDTTCPTDSTCHEALWCQPDRSWVIDCDWCSEPELCGSVEGEAVYQCFHDFGACSGNGEEYCAPCYTDDDCPNGGQCYYEPYMANTFCTMPCEDEGSVRTCPEGHYCQMFGLPYQNDYQCLPRQGSCSQPSGGLRTCDICETFGDCLSGLCLGVDLSTNYPPYVCWEDCSADRNACPPYTECHGFIGTDGSEIYLCEKQEGFSCIQVRNCREECPEGPDSCSDDAEYYCLE